MKQRFLLLIAALAFGAVAVNAAGAEPAQAPEEAAQVEQAAAGTMEGNATQEANATDANATAEETQPMQGGDATTNQP